LDSLYFTLTFKLLNLDAPFDWEELEKELDKMKIKELRAVLNKLNDPCKGCSEKGDLISRIRELRPAKTDDKTEL
jgi:hypothetical protein